MGFPKSESKNRDFGGKAEKWIQNSERKGDGSLICFKGFRTLLNVRRDYIVQALPYIEDKEITDILSELGK